MMLSGVSYIIYDDNKPLSSCDRRGIKHKNVGFKVRMEILNVLKEIKSRYLSASQVRIEDFAWRRYRMNKEEVNEI